MDPDPRTQFEAWQDQWLAPFALRSRDGGGRVHAEPEHPYRTGYQRDRDRIVHCAAFRRLDYKTQVFVPHEQDHLRTRMTHTLEVAQIARTLARALRANEDVAEAVALAHDLGHPPFGHAGEAALHELMAGAGGFEHNRHSLRVVDYLEHPYPAFRGLNLTRAVRLGLAKHQTPYDAPQVPEFAAVPHGPLEGQLVDLADEIAYTSADLFDALGAGWVSAADVAGLDLWQWAYEQAVAYCGKDTPKQTTLGGATEGEAPSPSSSAVHVRIRACANVLAIMVDEAIIETRERIQRLRPASPADVERAAEPVAAFSPRLVPAMRALQHFLVERVYRHPISLRNQEAGRQAIRGLFAIYLAEPARLPDRYRARIGREGLHRVLCDYVAGMTDRFCRQEYEKLEIRNPKSETNPKRRK